MNARTKIDWPGLDYTWSPITGCKRNCWYCWAKNRVWPRIRHCYGNVDFDKVALHEDRLKIAVKKPSTFFVGPYTDNEFWSFADWDAVLNVCTQNMRHTFMFISKSLEGYKKVVKHNWPDNCMHGLTIAGRLTELEFCKKIRELSIYHRPYLVLEPLGGPVYACDYSNLERVIVGRMSHFGCSADNYLHEYINTVIANIPAHKIYWKKNIVEYSKKGETK